MEIGEELNGRRNLKEGKCGNRMSEGRKWKDEGAKEKLGPKVKKDSRKVRDRE